MKWIRAPWFFKIFRHIRGITLGPGIVLSKWYEWEATPAHWAHERMHTIQQERVGWIKFYFIILGQYIRYGYKNAPFEVEAREYASDLGRYVLDWRVMNEEHRDQWG